jgi:hypothetical protein
MGGVLDAEIVTGLAFVALAAFLLLLLQAGGLLRLKIKQLIVTLLIAGVVFQGWYWASLVAEGVNDWSGDFGSCVQQIDLLKTAGLTVESVSEPPRPAAFCMKGYVGVFHTHYQYLGVYSLIDKSRQDKAIAILTDYQKQHQIAPTILKIYARENWITDGRGGGTRGNEQVILTRVIR